MTKLTRQDIINMTQEQLENEATKIADYITIRDYDNYGSIDTKRLATPEEFNVTFNIVVSLLLAYSRRDEGDINSLLDMAEYIGHRFISNMNTYDTIYIPVKKLLGCWD